MLGGAWTERPLDRNSPIPLYFQIAENLKQAIEDGTLKPGDRLDNELDLTERLGVSRPTVRQAVQRLVEQGLVVRRRGLGTVIVAPRILRSVALTSLMMTCRRTTGIRPPPSWPPARSRPTTSSPRSSRCPPAPRCSPWSGCGWLTGPR